MPKFKKIVMDHGVSYCEVPDRPESAISYGGSFHTPPFTNGSLKGMTDFSSCDTMEKKKEVTVLSYVGVLRSDQGVVAFSDSRGTYENQGVTQYHGDDVKKVFSSEQFVFATFGANLAYSEEKKPVKLEIVLDRILDGFSGTHRDYFRKLYKELLPHFRIFQNDQFRFLIGFRDFDGVFGTEVCTLSRLEADFSGPSYISGYHTGGFRNFGLMNPIIPDNLSVQKMEMLARKMVQNAEETGDICLDYNPVGGSVQIAIIGEGNA